MAALVIVVFAQVLLRYLTYQPLGWTEELARYVFIWTCLLGAAVAARRGQHFAVDLAVRSVPSSARWIVAAAIQTIEAALYVALAYAGVQILPIVASQESPSVGANMSLPYVAIPLGASLIAASSLVRLISVLRCRGS
jgi:TRAP-type C4-dicarboxylate transport system permease small subunit